MYKLNNLIYFLIHQRNIQPHSAEADKATIKQKKARYKCYYWCVVWYVCLFVFICFTVKKI